MRAFVDTLFARDRLLAGAALAFAAGFVLAAVAALFDTRLITGINPWIKPMKFLSSIAIYLATIAWFTSELQPRRAPAPGSSARSSRRWSSRSSASRARRRRGTTSHFNQSSVFDAVVFGLMGLAIAVNTAAAAAMLWFLRREMPPQRAGYLWGVRLGLAVFVVGSLLGFVIVANNSHSVPGPDGGRGLPFLNWSVDRGDLRVAHFVGLHALQALPLLGFLLDQTSASPAARTGTVSTVAVVWTLVMGVTLALALGGRPLLAL